MIIKTINWEDALPIRHKVLWPSKPAEFCKIDGDIEANHYGIYIEEKLVSVASVYIEAGIARLRKFATLADFQGKGLGTLLISHIINVLKGKGIEVFWCDARTTAINFYRKFNMLQQGNEFNKSGILYVKMAVNLTQ